jgi:hypothetical protein
MKTRTDILRDEALRIICFVQDELRIQFKRGEDPQNIDATGSCVDGVMDIMGACECEISANAEAHASATKEPIA